MFSCPFADSLIEFQIFNNDSALEMAYKIYCEVKHLFISKYERRFLNYDFLYESWIVPAVEHEEEYFERVELIQELNGYNKIKPSAKDYENYLAMIKLVCDSIINKEWIKSEQLVELANNLLK